MKRKRELRRVPSPAHTHFDASLPITKSRFRTKFFRLVLTALEYFFHPLNAQGNFVEKSRNFTIPKQELVVYVIWCLTYCKHTRAIAVCFGFLLFALEQFHFRSLCRSIISCCLRHSFCHFTKQVP